MGAYTLQLYQTYRSSSRTNMSDRVISTFRCQVVTPSVWTRYMSPYCGSSSYSSVTDWQVANDWRFLIMAHYHFCFGFKTDPGMVSLVTPDGWCLWCGHVSCGLVTFQVHFAGNRNEYQRVLAVGWAHLMVSM